MCENVYFKHSSHSVQTCSNDVNINNIRNSLVLCRNCKLLKTNSSSCSYTISKQATDSKAASTTVTTTASTTVTTTASTTTAASNCKLVADKPFKVQGHYKQTTNNQFGRVPGFFFKRTKRYYFVNVTTIKNLSFRPVDNERFATNLRTA